VLERLADDAADAVHVQAQVGEQFAALGVFDEAVGDAQADEVAGVEPALLAASRTALPKPPSSVPSSTVTTSGNSSMARRSVPLSSGLARRR